MLWRFCLYGFLKNQQYFEPFLVLAFLEKGLSFFQIGLLIATREITINLFEIISGAVADVYGRRRAMITSFAAYIISFLAFGLATNLTLLFLAMFLFGIGESFRTGTHKAMIFTWLRLQNRSDERTRVYGQTRSWSKIGSAVSVVLAAMFVVLSNRFVTIFYFSIIPYALGIINFLSYPKELDGTTERNFSISRIVIHLKKSLLNTFQNHCLRKLVFESMGFEGIFRATKDYLQPILQTTALLLGAQLTGISLGKQQQTALLVGPVFFLLYLLSATASRHAHRLVERVNGEDRAARFMWGLNFLVFTILVPAMWFNLHGLIIAGFVCLFVFQNFWRPILISRFDTYCDENQGATVLSVESQAKSLATMFLAPVLGGLVDMVKQHELGGEFWPIGVIGAVVALVFFVLAGSSRPAKSSNA